MELQRYVIEHVPVLISPMEHTHGAAISVWSRVGARDEPSPMDFGLTHFLEHMVFKGSDAMSATDIARSVERVGGDLDAFTTRDHICFVAKVPSEQVALGMNILTELLAKPAFRPEELERERSVVMEEIRISRDDPDDSGDECFLSRIYPTATLGRSILGSDDTVRRMTRTQVQDWWRTCLGRDNVVISVAGHVDADRVRADMERFVAALPQGDPVIDNGHQPFSPSRGSRFREQMEAVNVYLAFEAPPPDMATRQVLSVLNNVLGGGMSSRLFRKIREEKGLAYAVYGSPSWFRHEGHLYLTATTAPSQAETVRELMRSESISLKDTLTEAEVADAVSQLAGRIELSLETSVSLAMFHGRYEVQDGHPVSVDALVASIRNISFEAVRSLAADMLTEERMASLLYGNVDEKESVEVGA